jgi:hypothetical protein
MKTRCTNKDQKDWMLYGGRGITYCERWNTFENFLEDMGEVPKGFSLERKDVNLNYSKDNCVWATAVEQANNTRRNVLIEWQGKTQTASEWCRELGLPPSYITNRLARGWSIAAALTTPVASRKALNAR